MLMLLRFPVVFLLVLTAVGELLLTGGTPSALAADRFEPTAQDQIVPADAKLELLWNEGAFTEGPTVAADGAILFTDIGTRIMRFDPADGKVSVFRENSGKANGLMFDQQGRLIACEGAMGGNRRVSITDRAGAIKTLADRFEGKKFNSPNDLAIDARGRVYFTDPRYAGDEPRELDFEGVFLVDGEGRVTLATRDVQRPNGILVSADGRTVFVADNHSDPQGNHHLLTFRVADDGTLVDKRILFDFGPNRRGIDGMTLDVQGNVYATAGSGSEAGVYVFSPSGKALAFIATPGDPTNCVFGSGKEAKRLYITGAGPKVAGQAARYALYRIDLKIEGQRIFP
jgi:sugar lactone lactonase YvrE